MLLRFVLLFGCLQYFYYETNCGDFFSLTRKAAPDRTAAVAVRRDLGAVFPSAIAQIPTKCRSEDDGRDSRECQISPSQDRSQKWKVLEEKPIRG